jgi:GrpB-like predicted nucleotidyltransferase (UPF0157 family)
VSDTLTIVPYDTSWPSQFQAERRRIAAALGSLAVRIDHNGSTSVPGLAAKPIIDIQVSVASLHPIEVYSPQLQQLGYAHRAHADDSFSPFFSRPAEWPHSHHIHVVESGGEEERRTLAFRDYLRDHEAVARAYETLKRELAPQFSAASFESRQSYADAKGEFIERVIAQARQRGYPLSL